MKLLWKHASPGDLKLLRLITFLLSRHPKLIPFLFRPDRAELQGPPPELIQEARAFSSGEQLLVRIALDLWSDSGNATLWELLKWLDPLSFDHTLFVLRYLKLSNSTDDTLDAFDEYEAHLESLERKHQKLDSSEPIDF